MKESPIGPVTTMFALGLSALVLSSCETGTLKPEEQDALKIAQCLENDFSTTISIENPTYEDTKFITQHGDIFPVVLPEEIEIGKFQNMRLVDGGSELQQMNQLATEQAATYLLENGFLNTSETGMYEFSDNLPVPAAPDEAGNKAISVTTENKEISQQEIERFFAIYGQTPELFVLRSLETHPSGDMLERGIPGYRQILAQAVGEHNTGFDFLINKGILVPSDTLFIGDMGNSYGEMFSAITQKVNPRTSTIRMQGGQQASIKFGSNLVKRTTDSAKGTGFVFYKKK